MAAPALAVAAKAIGKTILKKYVFKAIKWGLAIQFAVMLLAGMLVFQGAMGFEAAASGGTGGAWSDLAKKEIPAQYLALYEKYGAFCPGLDMQILAAVGRQESNHGQGTGAGIHSGANGAGAKGPMQFLQGTFDAYAIDGNNDGKKDVYDPEDAIPSAANYLCSSGGASKACQTGGKPDLSKGSQVTLVDNGGEDGQMKGTSVQTTTCMEKAIFAYNHSTSYVADIIARANKYRSADGAFSGSGELGPMPKQPPRTVKQALAWAEGQTTNPSQNWYYACLAFVARSYGLTSNVDWAIHEWDGIRTQYRHPGDKSIPAGALVFWDLGAGHPGHIALSAGNGMVYSNDIRRKGKIDLVPADEITKKWGAKYVGWTPPYFPKASY